MAETTKKQIKSKKRVAKHCEVFTPPEIANRMLDSLQQEVFKSKETTFLDSFTKSGVFLRKITKRLLSHQIPNYEEISGETDKIGFIESVIKLMSEVEDK